MKSWLYEKSIKIKTLFLLTFFISIYGCTINVQPVPSNVQAVPSPVETSVPVPPPPPPPPPSSSCSPMYDIYAKCFGVGIGSDSNKCKTLAAAVANEFKSKLPDNGGELLGLMCGIACIEGSQNSGLPPYSEFAKEYCKQ